MLMINKLHKTERKRNSYRSRFRALKIRMRLGYGLFLSFVLPCVNLLRFLAICMLYSLRYLFGDCSEPT